MTEKSLNTIRQAVDEIRQQKPRLFGVLSATLYADNLVEARQSLGYDSAESFTADYHDALESLSDHIREMGYDAPSATEPFENRIDSNGHLDNTRNPAVPSPELVDRWYRGHILHEALGLIRKQNGAGVEKLWDRFPDRRLEIEIAFALAGKPADPSPLSVLPRAPLPTVPQQQAIVQRTLPILAGVLALGVALVLAFSPPDAGRALKAIAGSLEDGVFSAQGIFNFSNDALKKAEAPGAKPDTPVPKPRAIQAPKPVPRPQIALPSKPKLEMATLPAAPRKLDVPRTRIKLQTRPDVSVPRVDVGAGRPTYFGSHSKVEIARPRSLSQAARPLSLSRPNGSGPGTETPALPSSSNLNGYLPAGRVGFSSFQTSRSLSGELVRLTRIERHLSGLQKPKRKTFEGAHLALSPDRARVQFPDGVAFAVTFKFGRLDDIQIFLKSGITRKLHAETEARRGIRLLDRALNPS